MQQNQKPKRSLPVPPSSKYGDRSPSRSHELESSKPDYDSRSRRCYSSLEARRREYRASRSDPDTLVANSRSPYETISRTAGSYGESNSPRPIRDDYFYQSPYHKSMSSHSLKKDIPRMCSRDDKDFCDTKQSRPLHEEDRNRNYEHRDSRKNSGFRKEDPNYISSSPSWQRASLPSRTRPRSPNSSMHSWQRSSLPTHGRNQADYLTEDRHSKEYSTRSSYHKQNDRPSLKTSLSESHSSNYKKRPLENRGTTFHFESPKDHKRKNKDSKYPKDPNAPFEAHFRQRRDSSLDVGAVSGDKIIRSSSIFRDFLHSDSYDDPSFEMPPLESEVDEAYKILKEGRKIAKDRVVYKYERSASEENQMRELARDRYSYYDASRSFNDYDHYEQRSPRHLVSGPELDRISYFSSRSNPLDNHSSAYVKHHNSYVTCDPYDYSSMTYRNYAKPYLFGSNVTQTSTQTDETCLSGPTYKGCTDVPNTIGWGPNVQRGNKRGILSCICDRLNFFHRRQTAKEADCKMLYMKTPSQQHCTQVLATLAVALGPLCAGLGKGYSSPALASMAALSAQGHHFSISKDQGSWVASLSLLGAFFGSFPAGMSIRFGRKRILCIVAVPFALSWVLTVVATNVYMLYAASFLGGVCTAIIAVVTPVYISEIAHPDIRGCLCALSKLSSNIGMLLSYLLGAFLNWRQLATVTASAPACLFLAAMLIPETPSYLLYRGRDTEAAAALSWLRSGKDVARELTTMKANIATLRRNEALEPPSYALRDLIRPLFVTCGLMVFQKFSGANAFNFYAVPILSETFVGLDPYRAAIVVAFVQICAGMASSALVDTVGRRPLLVFSNMLMSAALAAFGGYVYLKGLDTNEDMFARQQWRQSDWVPLFCILVIEIAFALGVSPISWLYIGELFPLKHRGFGALAASVSYACSFASVKSFVDLQLTIGLYGTFWLYSSLAALALVFTLVFVPETKGLSLQEMQEQHKTMLL